MRKLKIIYSPDLTLDKALPALENLVNEFLEKYPEAKLIYDFSGWRVWAEYEDGGAGDAVI